jgi:hypothetical protein
MDRAFELMTGGRVIEGMSHLRLNLGKMRTSISPQDWIVFKTKTNPGRAR